MFQHQRLLMMCQINKKTNWNKQTTEPVPTQKQDISSMINNIGIAQDIKNSTQNLKKKKNIQDFEGVTETTNKKTKQTKSQILAIGRKQFWEDPEQYWKDLQYTTEQFAKYHLTFRWTEHPDNDQYIFKNPIIFQDKIIQATTLEGNIINIQKMVFQIERGFFEETQKLHYQGYLHLIKKKRPKSLAKKLNSLFFGI